MKIIGVIGSRRRNSRDDFSYVSSALLKYFKDEDILCSGGCPTGGDNFAEIIAKRDGLSILIHYPNWNGIGYFAGYQRNTKIAKSSTMLIACVTEDRTGGTEDTIKKFKDRIKDYEEIMEDGNILVIKPKEVGEF